jgi:hypothetical protein
MAKPANRMFTQHSRDALLADPRSNSTSQPGTSDALQNASVRCSGCGVPMPEPPTPDGDGICLFDTCKACIEAQRQKDAASTDGLTSATVSKGEDSFLVPVGDEDQPNERQDAMATGEPRAQPCLSV